MHSRASLFCPVDNTARLFNHHQTSKATTIISIIPTTVGQVIIATKFSLQPEFGFFFFPKVRLNPCFFRMSRWGPIYLPQPSKGLHLLVWDSNTLQVKSGPSCSKQYTCAFLLPVCSLPSRFLDNRDVRVGDRSSTFSRGSHFYLGALLDGGCSVRCGPSFSCEDRFVSGDPLLHSANTFAPYNWPKSARPHHMSSISEPHLFFFSRAVVSIRNYPFSSLLSFSQPTLFQFSLLSFLITAALSPNLLLCVY
ncbi:unnamed protein product [Acanthosepion pharaonis]|uniref:Uncharacterized protein n=1 Tax=Acanthosepion pharaonis TaxID=158019 RepID=A0A812CQM6_ACAPH|nr:unnamed protein product [Sepia pharaonis]